MSWLSRLFRRKAPALQIRYPGERRYLPVQLVRLTHVGIGCSPQAKTLLRPMAHQHRGLSNVADALVPGLPRLSPEEVRVDFVEDSSEAISRIAGDELCDFTGQVATVVVGLLDRLDARIAGAPGHPRYVPTRRQRGSRMGC